MVRKDVGLAGKNQRYLQHYGMTINLYDDNQNAAHENTMQLSPMSD